MISTSFLRTLNPKRYNEYTSINRNRLRVYYIRTINKLNKEARVNNKSQKIAQLKSNRCTCKKQHSELKQNLSEKFKYDIDKKQRQQNFENCFQFRDSYKQRKPGKFQAKNIIMDFQNTRLHCERKLQKMQKQNLMQCRKLTCVNNKVRRTVGRSTALQPCFQNQMSPR